MSGDEEFGRVVGDRLRDEVADIHADPGLAGAVRRQHTKRAWAIRTSIGAPLVAAAAAVAVVVAGAGPGATTPEQQRGGQAAPPAPTTTQPRVENLAHVQDMTIQALRSAEEYVIHEKNMLDSGYLEYWTDRATRRYRVDTYTTYAQRDEEVGADGTTRLPANPNEPPTGPLRRTQSIAGEGEPGDMHYVFVDYDRKTWATDHDTSPPPEPHELEVPDVLDPDALKQAIA